MAETGDRMKLDHGKDPWHLAPWDAFLAIVKVLAFGAAKYRERGWEEGMAWSRVYSACMRHLTDWFQQRDKGKGKGRDADTGYSDLWHAGCCVCFLIAYEMRGMVTHDDRPAPLCPCSTPEVCAVAQGEEQPSRTNKVGTGDVRFARGTLDR